MKLVILSCLVAAATASYGGYEGYGYGGGVSAVRSAGTPVNTYSQIPIYRNSYGYGGQGQGVGNFVGGQGSYGNGGQGVGHFGNFRRGNFGSFRRGNFGSYGYGNNFGSSFGQLRRRGGNFRSGGAGSYGHVTF